MCAILLVTAEIWGENIAHFSKSLLRDFLEKEKENERKRLRKKWEKKENEKVKNEKVEGRETEAEKENMAERGWGGGWERGFRLCEILAIEAFFGQMSYE